MRDNFGRTINYMRISITDRCNLHCSYCQPEIAEHLKHSDILSYEEILLICRAAVEAGITRFKVTGGEPFARVGAIDFIRDLKAIPGVEAVTVTTNGTLLDKEMVKALFDAKVDGVNVSLDTQNSKRFAKITGANELDNVRKALDLLTKYGLNVKTNTVMLPDMDEKEVLSILELAKEKAIAVRFIETMPMNDLCEPGMTGQFIMSVLDKNNIRYSQVNDILGNGPAKYFKPEGYAGYFGLIEAIHGKFCRNCNRIRLTSTGYIKPCLYHKNGIDLRDAIRNGETQNQIYEKICKVIYDKPKAHNFEKKPADENMSKIGG